MPPITSKLDWSPKAQVSIVLSGTLIILLMMTSVFYLGNRIAGHHAPLVDATMELKLQITTGHLWFEEIVSGDSNESIDTVWYSLDRADGYAKSLLQGGDTLQGDYPALEDEHLRELISSVRNSLEEFRQITRQRYQEGGKAGSELDQRYDAIFADVLSGAEKVELDVLALIKREYRQYVTLGYSLLILAILAIMFMTRLVYSNGLANQKLVNSIAETNRTIEAQNRELDYKAHFDALTGLPNRVLFLDRVNQTILQAKRDGYSFALLYADFDHFKHINDVFGHAAGDHALRQIAERILTCIRESDTAARISGDEFGVILSNRTQSHLDKEVCRNLASKLNQIMRQPIPYKEHALHSSVSIGIAIYPENGTTAEQLMVNADAAMYQAKSQGKDRFGFYTPQLGQAIHEQNLNLSLIRHALHEDQLVVHYQPQILLGPKKLYGFEALARIQRDEQLMLPYQFIPIAEKFAMIDLIDFQVLEQALRQARKFIDDGIEFQRMAVNVSTLTLLQKGFVSRVKEALIIANIEGSKLELEITESALAKDLGYTTRLLENLHELGISIAIDDFGTGYSSMSYLKDLKVDSLKIDRSFISNYSHCASTEAILQHIVQLGRALNLDIIAEGIEQEKDVLYLTDLGCNIGQGYYFARPAAPGSIAEQISEFGFMGQHG